MENFEKVNQHVESVNTDLKGAKLQQVWSVAKPIFNLLISLPIIPQKWKSILLQLSLTLDSVSGEQS